MPASIHTIPVAPSRPAPARLRSPPARSRITVEIRPSAPAGEESSWRALARAALEPNVFAGPDVLPPALQHLEGGRLVSVACLRRGDALVGLVPLATRRLPPFGPTRLWHPPLAPPAAPLIEAALAEEAIEALLDGLALQCRPAPLEIDGVRSGGPLAGAFAQVAQRTGRRFEALAWPRERARRAEPPRLLCGNGSVRVEQASGADEVRDGVEHFLALEAAAARRHGRAALIQTGGQATFLRTATRQLARSGLCRIDLVQVGDETAGALIAVKNGGRWTPWLAASDDRFSGLSGDALAAWITGDQAGPPASPLLRIRIATRAAALPS